MVFAGQAPKMILALPPPYSGDMIRENMPCHAATSPIPWGVFKPKASPTEHMSAENSVNVDLSTVLQRQSQSYISLPP